MLSRVDHKQGTEKPGHVQVRLCKSRQYTVLGHRAIASGRSEIQSRRLSMKVAMCYSQLVSYRHSNRVTDRQTLDDMGIAVLTDLYLKLITC